MENKGTQKTAIITGGAAGLGIAIAQKFVEQNIHIIIIGRNETKLKEACQSLGPLAGYVTLDLTRLNEIPPAVKAIAERFGSIDILVNNAGIHLKKALLDVSNEEYQGVILTNQTSVFAFTREVAGYMKIAGLRMHSEH